MVAGAFRKESVDLRVEIKTLERLMQPGEAEVCLRYILKHATRRGSNMFQLFDTKEKKGPFRGKQKALVEAPKERGVGLARKLAKCVARPKCQGRMANAPPCP